MHKFSFFLTSSDKFLALRTKQELKHKKTDSYLQCLVDLFYPETCLECNRILVYGCKVLCHSCRSDLPRCNFSDSEGNRAEALFQGRAEIRGVTSLLYFRKKGMVQRLMHALKYRGREDIGRYLGLMLGAEIAAGRRFASVDLVIPVPLHYKKQRSRGYNQVSEFGRCLSESLGVPFLENALLRNRPGASQTDKSRIERNRNLENSFVLGECKNMIDKHVLIVDDIITSGATLEICARKVLEVSGTRVSLASMAFTL